MRKENWTDERHKGHKTFYYLIFETPYEYIYFYGKRTRKFGNFDTGFNSTGAFVVSYQSEEERDADYMNCIRPC